MKETAGVIIENEAELRKFLNDTYKSRHYTSMPQSELVERYRIKRYPFMAILYVNDLSTFGEICPDIIIAYITKDIKSKDRLHYSESMY